MADTKTAVDEQLVAPWADWARRYTRGRRLLEAGTYALTEGAIAAGCRVFAGYPITPATDIAEYMSKRLPQVGGYYVQCEDELAGMHACAGASLGGLKAMTATSGPGYTLMHDAYGWSITNEIPLVVVDAMRVGPISGITGAPGQGEFYIARYASHGGNFETIVLSPSSVQEAFWLTIDAFNLAERFRTPVTILTAQCEAILDGVAAPSPEQVASLYEEVLRLGRVIEDLETLASAEAAGLRLDRAPVDLAALVEQTTDLLEPQFEAAEVGLATRLEPATVSGDPLRLAQVVRNLLSNALKFTPAGGQVEVALAGRDGVVELAVSDSGVGIPPDELPHVFERFWRGANGRGTAGSGVGLAVVDQLVRAHGGSVTAASEPGGGAVFTVELPRG
jgi:two-component sensor histidine kinase